MATMATKQVEAPVIEAPKRTAADVVAALRAFDVSPYLRYRKQAGQDLAYVSWFDRVEILDQVAPGWQYSIEEVKQVGEYATVVARISVYGDEDQVSRESTGSEKMGQNGYGDPIANAEATALSRASAKLGLGIRLYKKDNQPAQNYQPQGNYTQNGGGGEASPAQVKAIYAIARNERNMSMGQVDEESTRIYSVPPADLSKRQASEFIDRLKGTPPSNSFSPAPAATGGGIQARTTPTSNEAGHAIQDIRRALGQKGGPGGEATVAQKNYLRQLFAKDPLTGLLGTVSPILFEKDPDRLTKSEISVLIDEARDNPDRLAAVASTEMSEAGFVGTDDLDF